MKTRLDFVQLVLFSSGITIVDKLETAGAINNNLSGVFDGDPVILPIPENAPPEIPRIQLSSKDGQYNLSIARNRLDFIFRYKKDKGEDLFPISGIFEKFLTTFKYFREKIHTQITRSAIVKKLIIELEKNHPAEILLSRYIRSHTPVVNPYELELRYFTKESIAGFEVNKWTRIASSRKISLPEQSQFIILNMDINTITEKVYEFDRESLQKFLVESNKVIDETVETHLKNIEGI